MLAEVSSVYSSSHFFNSVAESPFSSGSCFEKGLGNLETYLEHGIVNVDHLGALGEVIKGWKKEQGKGTVTKKRKRKGG